MDTHSPEHTRIYNFLDAGATAAKGRDSELDHAVQEILARAADMDTRYLRIARPAPGHTGWIDITTVNTRYPDDTDPTDQAKTPTTSIRWANGHTSRTTVLSIDAGEPRAAEIIMTNWGFAQVTNSPTTTTFHRLP